MSHISIISSSIRDGRKSNRVALYFKNFIETNTSFSVEILDLDKYNFPLFKERLRLQQQPSSAVIDFADKIKNSDGLLIITPEYNGGYPASLKNVVDLLYNEWYHKPIAISTVSSGSFGGTQVLMQLQFILWKMKAFTVPSTFPVPNVEESFNEEGIAYHKAKTNQRAKTFIDELLWCIEAKQKMLNKS